MKIDFDIPDSEIKAQIENKIRETLTSKNNGYGAAQYITARVEKLWPEVADKIIAQMIEDSPKLKAAIQAEIEKKLRRKIATLMNAAETTP